MPDPALLARLRALLEEPLPGLEAQGLMAPQQRIDGLRNFVPPEDARQGAVLILLYPSEAGIQLPLILRPDYDGVHARQVGLPGGAVEPQDENRTATALREAQEEIGVSPPQVDILGRLSDLYIPPSNFVVAPIVGAVKKRPSFVLDPVEVSQLIEAPMGHFLDAAYRGKKDIHVRGNMRLHVPCFEVGGHTIWGATAMMMAEFAEVYRKALL